VREGEFPEAAVARIAVELLPPTGGVRDGDQSAPHEPEDPAIDGIVRRVPVVFDPRADEQALVWREVVKLFRHLNQGRGWLEGGTIPLMRR